MAEYLAGFGWINPNAPDPILGWGPSGVTGAMPFEAPLDTFGDGQSGIHLTDNGFSWHFTPFPDSVTNPCQPSDPLAYMCAPPPCITDCSPPPVCTSNCSPPPPNNPPTSTVPEPATWLALIAGFIVAGIALRARRVLA